MSLKMKKFKKIKSNVYELCTVSCCLDCKLIKSVLGKIFQGTKPTPGWMDIYLESVYSIGEAIHIYSARNGTTMMYVCHKANKRSNYRYNFLCCFDCLSACQWHFDNWTAGVFSLYKLNFFPVFPCLFKVFFPARPAQLSVCTRHKSGNDKNTHASSPSFFLIFSGRKKTALWALSQKRRYHQTFLTGFSGVLLFYCYPSFEICFEVHKLLLLFPWHSLEEAPKSFIPRKRQKWQLIRGTEFVLHLPVTQRLADRASSCQKRCEIRPVQTFPILTIGKTIALDKVEKEKLAASFTGCYFCCCCTA